MAGRDGDSSGVCQLSDAETASSGVRPAVTGEPQDSAGEAGTMLRPVMLMLDSLGELAAGDDTCSALGAGDAVLGGTGGVPAPAEGDRARGDGAAPLPVGEADLPVCWLD